MNNMQGQNQQPNSGVTDIQELMRMGSNSNNSDISEVDSIIGDIDVELIEEIRIKYPTIHAEVVDVGDEKAVQEFCLKSIDALGGVDCLVNNAGVAGPTLPIEEIGSEDWANCLNICLNSQFYFIKSC